MDKSLIKSSAKGEGSKGGNIIGHTRSGKAVYRANTLAYAKGKDINGQPQLSYGRRTTAEIAAHHEGWSKADHRDAAQLHARQSEGPWGDSHHISEAHRRLGSESPALGFTKPGGKKVVMPADSDRYADMEGQSYNAQEMIDRHPRWKAEDHYMAAGMHRAASQSGNPQMREDSMKAANLHQHAGDAIVKRMKKSEEPDFQKARGAGSRGGVVVGQTKSGKPKYQVGQTLIHKKTGEKFKVTGHRINSFDGTHRYSVGNEHLDPVPNMHESSLDQHFDVENSRKSKMHKSLFDTAELMQQMMIQQAQDQATMVPSRTDVLNSGGDGGVPTQVEQAGANVRGMEMQGLPFRVDVLAPTPYSTQETLAMAKSIARMPAAQHQGELVRAGLAVVGPRRVNLAKSTMSLVEFADAVGTTEDTVRRLAKRCGDPAHFVAMIKDKMPDIQRAHSLSDDDAQALYATAMRTVKSLGPAQWDQWCSKSFASQQVTDQGIADAIQMNGFMHRNQCTSEGFAVMGGPVAKEPRQDLPKPEPIAQPVEARPLIGGNLSIGVRSADVGPYAFRS